MKTYEVTLVRHVTLSYRETYRVQAESEEQAIELAELGSSPSVQHLSTKEGEVKDSELVDAWAEVADAG